MKVREIEANVKIADDSGSIVSVINAKGKYSEPETWDEVLDSKSFSNDEKLRIFNYGLNTLEQSKLRSQNNLGPVCKKLVDAEIFTTHKEAFEHLIHLKNAKK
jgi:hypothetical protein